MHFDLTDLRLFLHVVEAGSITAGAGRAGLSLAAASTRIRDMEHQAGIALLERGRRGVRPTPAGQALFRHARTLTGQIERMRGELGDFAAGLTATLRLLANTAAIGEFLPEALADFLVAHPNVNVDLDECASPEAAQAVAEGMADIAVVAGHADLAGLEAFAFRDDRLVLAVARDHPLAAHDAVTLAQALDSDFIGLGGDSALQRHLSGHVGRSGRPMRLRARVRGLDALCRMVSRGAGAAIVPEAAARRSAARDALRLVRLDEPWAERRLLVVVRRMDSLSVHAQRLVRALCGSTAGIAEAATGRSR